MSETPAMERFYDGGCTCRHVRYRMTTRPLFVHCCHCCWCQRETGSAFALNAMIESDRVQLLEGEVVVVDTPSNSGKGQRISRCPRCEIAVWSSYAGAGDAIRFVRVGTLDEPSTLPPDIHIYTASKHAVEGLTKALALEFAKQNIRINAVAPAGVATDMVDRFAGKEGEMRDYFTSLHPVGRIGTSEEIAAAVLYLCSDDAKFTTGTSLVVDGGMLAQ